MAERGKGVKALPGLKGQGCPPRVWRVCWGRRGLTPQFSSTASPPHSPNLHHHLRGFFFPFLQAGVSPEIRQLFT